MALWHPGLAPGWVPPDPGGPDPSVSSQVFCLGSWSMQGQQGWGNGGGLVLGGCCAAGRGGGGEHAAPEPHSLITSSAEMCSILFICPSRPLCALLPFAMYPRAVFHLLYQVPLDLLLLLGQPIGSLGQRSGSGTRERRGYVFPPVPPPCSVAAGWLLPLTEASARAAGWSLLAPHSVTYARRQLIPCSEVGTGQQAL